MMLSSWPARRSVAAVLALLLLGGCASVGPERGFDAVSALAKDRTGKDAKLLRNDDDAQSFARITNAILGKPLSADDAVQLALLNNPDLQATYWNVGIAQADLAQAGRLQNPSLGFQRTRAGGDIEIDRSLTFNFIGLLTMPLARRIEGNRFEQTKLFVANQIVQHAAETRRAYYEAIAAVQEVDYAKQVSSSAEASAELANRMAQAGNASQLDLAREQAFYAEAAAAVASASKRSIAARERLTRQMGLWGANAAYTLQDRLPELPAAPAELDNVERTAVRERLDIEAARREALQTAASLGLTRTTRFVNVLDLGYVRNSFPGQAAVGYEISLELPLFDWGTARVARAEAIYMQSVNKVAQTATNARSEARESYLAYRASYDLARHYRDQVIPLRKKITDETQLRYNGMLASVFELLTESRAQVAAVNGYIAALKDYWIAQTNLEIALGGRLPSPVRAPDSKKEAQQ
ncbi:MAG: TolC family protein [Massilia sp.]